MDISFTTGIVLILIFSLIVLLIVSLIVLLIVQLMSAACRVYELLLCKSDVIFIATLVAEENSIFKNI